MFTMYLQTAMAKCAGQNKNYSVTARVHREKENARKGTLRVSTYHFFHNKPFDKKSQTCWQRDGTSVATLELVTE